MSEIFNKAVEQADKLSTQDNAGSVLDALYGKTEEAYEKFEKLPIGKQILASMAPGIGNIISAKEVDVFGGRAKEAFEEAKYGQAAGYGGLTALAALGTLPGVGLIGRGARTAMRSGAKLLDDPMEKAIKEVGEKAKIPETARGDWKYPEQGLKALDEPDINSILRKSGIDVDEIGIEKGLEIYGKKWKDKNLLPESQRQKQMPWAKEAAEEFEKGTLTGREFRDIIKSELPIKPINKMVVVPEFDEIAGVLQKNQVKKGIVGLTTEIPDGIRLSTRLDIPAYNKYNKWIVSIHEAGADGASKAYGKTAKLTNVVFGNAGADPTKALKIAKGTNKSPFARMEGDWNSVADDDTISFAKQLLKRKKNGKYIDEAGEEWIQVGMNPYRSSYFYDKATGQALQVADEVIQVGPLVFAKNALRIDSSRVKAAIKSFKKRYGKKPNKKELDKIRIDAKKPTLSEYKKGFTVQTGKGKKVFKQGGQIATGLAGLGENIVYRAEGDQVGMSGMGFDQLLSDDPAVQEANYSQYSTQQPEREDQSDDGWYENVIIDYDKNEIYADPLERTPANPEHIDEDNLVSLATKSGFYDRNTMPRNVLYHLLFDTPAGRASLNNMVNREGGFIGEKGVKGQEHLSNVYFLNEGYDNDDLDIIQSAINDGNLQGIGIEFANTMEYEGLNTFGKNLRSSMEAWTPGKGLSRDDYDPGILIGTAKYTDVASERKKALAAEAFTGMLDNAERGETISDISEQYWQTYGAYPPVESFGYNEDSNAQARDVAGAINDARGKGMMQGLSMLIAPGITTLPQILTAGYKTNSKGYSFNNDAFKQIKNKITTEISKYLPDFLTETSPDSDVKDYVKSMSPLDKQPESEKTGLDKAGDLVGTGAQIFDALRNPLDAAAQYGLKKAGEYFGLKSIRSSSSDEAAAAAREKSLSEDPTWRDRIRDFLPDFGSTPLPSANVYGGENVVETVQSPSAEIASLPIAPEEKKGDARGAMLAALTAPKPSQQNRHEDLINSLYSTNNIFQT